MPLWTIEQDDELKALYARELSCRVIGAQMGLSRNAIIGRVHRLKLKLRGASGNGKPADPNRIKKKRIRSGQGNHSGTVYKIVAQSTMKVVSSPRGGGALRLMDATTPQVKLRCVEVVQLKLTTTEIDLGTQCQWIEGDDHLHCGQPVKDGSAYCVPHHFICRRAPDDRPTGRVSKVSNRILAVA